ncbi:MAG: hypothetical protein ACFCU3_03580 [Verrucomicrobiales bacterium]
MVRTLGVGTGLMAIVVFGLYVYSPAVTELYARPLFLWGVCAVLFYWIPSLWMLGGREAIHHDPVLFAVRDKQSYLLFLIILAVGYLAKPLSLLS